MTLSKGEADTLDTQGGLSKRNGSRHANETPPIKTRVSPICPRAAFLLKFLEANSAKFGAISEIRSNLGAAVSYLDFTPIHLTLEHMDTNLSQTADFAEW